MPNTFADTPLLKTLLKSLKEQDITVPTDVQAQTLQPLLDGKSLVGVAETGSGKTLAFVLPLLHRLKTLELDGSSVKESGRPRGLVLVPGRELGEQVSKVFKSLTHDTRLRIRTALGGTKKQIARQNVNGPLEVLVATPGRLVQLMNSGELRLDDVRTLVFDEADQMLDAGFLPTVQRVLNECRKTVQVVMFSATLPQTLERVIEKAFVEPPVRVRTQGSQRLVPTLTVDNRNVINGRRFEVLMKALEEEPETGTMVFVNTREQADVVAEWLHTEGVPFANYRGQMDRQERRENLSQFREGNVHVLIATDLGGRGLDIERVDRVINVHLPTDIDNYLHRAGRTARAGRSGTVINLVTQRDQPLMAKLKKRAERGK